ncbi:zinc finger protein 2-like [Anastrepha obliqua]|uniref:zinc finger protein 2-like n=1 Tax=Anastrepha obliqua TaxID=95512 RepID=UPI00240959C7|nr:zinc finger protein 2-like [Anastrepha obliqua]
MKYNTMALGIEHERVEYEDLKICGEITTLMSIGKKEFFLNCEFCDASFLKLDDFIQHISEEHLSKFMGLNLKQNLTSCPLQSEEEIGDVEICMQSESFSEENDDTQYDLRAFEKIEIELDSNGINNSLDSESAALEEITDTESLQSLVTNELGEFSEEINETHGNADLIPYAQHDLCDAQLDLTEHCKNKDEKDDKKKFIIEFIEVYRSLQSLWNTNLKAYQNRVLKNEQYEILLKKYKEEYPEATMEDVKQKIQRLRSNFRRELRRMDPFGITTLYYFDAMNFLRNIIPLSESRKNIHGYDESQDALEPILKKFTVSESLLDDAQFIQLAKIYKKYPCLWDEKDIAYRFANRRREALNNVLKELNEKCKLNLVKNDFEKETARLRKICSNEKKQKIACKRNNLVFKPRCPYYDHISFLEVDVTPYECLICGLVVSGPCQFKIHLSSHDGSLPFKCHVCGHGFRLVTNLTVHLRRHVHDYTYSCKVCNKPCATTTELKTHLRLHTGERPYVCDICGKAMRSWAEFSRHMERHAKLPRHKCEICSKSFYEKRKLKEHMNVHLKVRNDICDVCNKGFTSVKLLRQHKLIHDIEKKFVCKLCGKRFAQCAGLNSHMKSHGTKLSAMPLRNFNLEQE